MIRKSIPILLSALVLLTFFQGCKKKTIETTTVKSASGLVLRDGPKVSSKKILVIPNNSSIDILSYSDNISVIGGKTAPWAEVRYNGKEGWVFSGYLANFTPQEFDDMSKLGSFARSPFIKKIFGQTIGTGIKESILNNIPGKGEVKSIDRENRHDPNITDRHHTITSSGLTFTIYEAVNLKKEIIESISITGNAIPLKYSIKIGATSKEIEEVFGKPSEKKNNEYIYATSDAINVTVIFSFKKDKLKKILIAYPVD